MESKYQHRLDGIEKEIEKLLTEKSKLLIDASPLSDKLNNGSWVINDYNTYYQFIGKNQYQINLERKGSTYNVGIRDFNKLFRVATLEEANQHEAFLINKNETFIERTPIIISEPKKEDIKYDFYMVTVTGEHGTKKRHLIYEEAEKEAIRLSEQENHEAFILGVIASVKTIITVTNEVVKR